MRSYIKEISVGDVEIRGKIKIGEHNDVGAIVRQLLTRIAQLEARVTALE